MERKQEPPNGKPQSCNVDLDPVPSPAAAAGGHTVAVQAQGGAVDERRSPCTGVEGWATHGRGVR